MATPAPPPSGHDKPAGAPPTLDDMDIDDCPEYIRRPGCEVTGYRRPRPRPAYHPPPRAHHRGRGR